VKDQEVHRLLDAVLHRLQLTPANVEKSECPDFFFRLGSSSVVTIGCELVRFHSTPEGASTLGHGLRWKRFAERLRIELQRHGIDVFGAIHLREDSKLSFEKLLRDEASAAAEICGRLSRAGSGDHLVDTFDPTTEPLLTIAVESIFVRPPLAKPSEPWWCASLQSGLCADPWPVLDEIIKTKNAKASSWNWRSVDERWLLIAAEATTLATTMVLLGRSEPLMPASAFTRVLAWDGFCERIHQLLPTFGTIFEMRARRARVASVDDAKQHREVHRRE
jgi:hypothetical protein